MPIRRVVRRVRERTEFSDVPDALWVIGGVAAGLLVGGWVLGRLRGSSPLTTIPDVARIQDDLFDGLGGTVRVQDLGEGIVELIGEAPSRTDADELASLVAEAPGVVEVVNRIWVVD